MGTQHEGAQAEVDLFVVDLFVSFIFAFVIHVVRFLFRTSLS
jgi:hypothetical protein